MNAPWLFAKTGDPKGPSPWNPTGRMALIANDVLDVVAMLGRADALPVGPRTIGYRLASRTNESGLRYVKYHKDAAGNPTEKVIDGLATFKDVEKAVKRLRQSGRLPWRAISDGSAVSHAVGGYDSLEGWIENRLNPNTFHRDLRHGQPVVAEIYVESAELTPLIARVAREYGVRTYSGRGSAGPSLARDTANRIVQRWNADEARTLILGIGDLDHAGVQNVMRPHIEHVGAFLMDACENDPVGMAEYLLDFKRIAITPEQAIEANTAIGVEIGALEDYLDSGDDDWERDVLLLKISPKTETEALDPTSLRDLIREALEDVLDNDLLQAVKDEEEEQRDRIPALVERFNGSMDE